MTTCTASHLGVEIYTDVWLTRIGNDQIKPTCQKYVYCEVKSYRHYFPEGFSESHSQEDTNDTEGDDDSCVVIHTKRVRQQSNQSPSKQTENQIVPLADVRRSSRLKEKSKGKEIPQVQDRLGG